MVLKPTFMHRKPPLTIRDSSHCKLWLAIAGLNHQLKIKRRKLLCISFCHLLFSGEANVGILNTYKLLFDNNNTSVEIVGLVVASWLQLTLVI